MKRGPGARLQARGVRTPGSVQLPRSGPGPRCRAARRAPPRDPRRRGPRRAGNRRGLTAHTVTARSRQRRRPPDVATPDELTVVPGRGAPDPGGREGRAEPLVDRRRPRSAILRAWPPPSAARFRSPSSIATWGRPSRRPSCGRSPMPRGSSSRPATTGSSATSSRSTRGARRASMATCSCSTGRSSSRRPDRGRTRRVRGHRWRVSQEQRHHRGLRFNPMKRNRGGEQDLDHIIAAIPGHGQGDARVPGEARAPVLPGPRVSLRAQRDHRGEGDHLARPQHRRHRHRRARVGDVPRRGLPAAVPQGSPARPRGSRSTPGSPGPWRRSVASWSSSSPTASATA